MTGRPQPTTLDGHPITACELPRTMEPEESEFYRRLHHANCARRNDPEHTACSGRLTLDRNGITRQCPRCGDDRSVHGGAA